MVEQAAPIQLLTLAETADLLSVDRSTLYRQAQLVAYPLPSVRIGRTVRVNPRALAVWTDRWLEGRR